MVATINLKYDNGKWIEEPFNGKKEEDYSDNTISLNQTLSERPLLPEFPTESSNSLWFPPIKILPPETETVTITKTEDVIGWKKIKVNPPQEPKIKIRLAPSE